MKLWSIDWTGFSWKVWFERTNEIPDPDEFGTYGDFFLIYILGLYIKIDLKPVGGRRHKELMEFIEILAKIEHNRWAHWQLYLHGKCTKKRNGDLIIPSDLVSRWERQINTPYIKLIEDEKESDREEAKRVLQELKEKKYFFKRKK